MPVDSFLGYNGSRDIDCCQACDPRLRWEKGTYFRMKITALIVDDEQPARDELVFLLKGFPDVEVVGQGKNGVDAVSLVRELSPHLVFLDVQMPGLDGFGVIKRLLEKKTHLPFFVFA